MSTTFWSPTVWPSRTKAPFDDRWVIEVRVPPGPEGQYHGSGSPGGVFQHLPPPTMSFGMLPCSMAVSSTKVLNVEPVWRPGSVMATLYWLSSDQLRPPIMARIAPVDDWTETMAVVMPSAAAWEATLAGQVSSWASWAAIWAFGSMVLLICRPPPKTAL